MPSFILATAIMANIFGYFVVQGLWRLGVAVRLRDTETIAWLRIPLLTIILFFVSFLLCFLTHGRHWQVTLLPMLAAQILQALEAHRRQTRGRGTLTWKNVGSFFYSF